MTHPQWVAENRTTHPLLRAQKQVTHPLSAVRGPLHKYSQANHENGNATDNHVKITLMVKAYDLIKCNSYMSLSF